MPLIYSVFEASKLVSTKTLLPRHYYHRRGSRNCQLPAFSGVLRSALKIWPEAGSGAKLALTRLFGNHPFAKRRTLKTVTSLN